MWQPHLNDVGACIFNFHLELMQSSTSQNGGHFPDTLASKYLVQLRNTKSNVVQQGLF